MKYMYHQDNLQKKKEPLFCLKGSFFFNGLIFYDEVGEPTRVELRC